MSLYDDIHKALESASLNDLINGDFGEALSDAALALAEAFSAMSAEQAITACHHDYQLSGKVRRAAWKLSILMEEQAEIMAEQERGQTRDDIAWDRGWDLTGDRLAAANR